MAITVAHDDQWPAFAALVTPTGALDDPALRVASGRQARHDALDETIAAFTRSRAVDDIVEQLTAIGVPAARVLAVPRMFDDPQLAARRYYVTLDHARTGRSRYPGWPMHFSFSPVQQRTGAPTMGQHNAEILGGELGLRPSELDELVRAGVIGDRMPEP